MKTKLPKTIAWNNGIYELEMVFSKTYPYSVEHEWCVRYVLREDISLPKAQQRAIISSEWSGQSLKKIEKDFFEWAKAQNAQEINTYEN